MQKSKLSMPWHITFQKYRISRLSHFTTHRLAMASYVNDHYGRDPQQHMIEGGSQDDSMKGEKGKLIFLIISHIACVL